MLVFAVSYGLLSLSARIYNPQSSCVITSHAVICLNMKGDSLQLSIYSIRHCSFGQCLWALPLTTGDQVACCMILQLVPSGGNCVDVHVSKREAKKINVICLYCMHTFLCSIVVCIFTHAIKPIFQ